MSYVNAAIIPVPTAKKHDYTELAKQMAALFKEYGALSVMEYWGDMVPDGVLTSFPKAVNLHPDEAVVLSLVRWPDRHSADACFAAMETDERFHKPEGMPFDTKRMIWASFHPLLEE